MHCLLMILWQFKIDLADDLISFVTFNMYYDYVSLFEN
jgi:hypothetical protein